MSCRPGQAGSVHRYRQNWIGQWLEDVNGQEKRIRKSVTLGPVKILTKSEARRMLQEHITKLGINSQDHLERSLSVVLTFKQAADKYVAGRLQDLKPSTRRSNEYHLRKYLRPRFDKTLVQDITADVVNEAIRTWAKKESLSSNTLRNLVATLRNVTGKNFGKAVKYPSEVEVRTDHEEACFTPEQMASIVELARRPHYVRQSDGSYIEGHVPGASPKMNESADATIRQISAFFATASGTGMRSGELCGLRIEDVDLQRGIISVRRSSWEGSEQTPKTRNAVRKIGIDAVVVQMLRQQIGQRKIGYVFSARNGNPLREGNILKRHLHPILKRLGIPRCGMHAFRHGRVSFLVENNVPLPMIRLWIGHGSDRMVQRYTHARPEFHANVISKLPTIANMQTEAA